MKHLIILTMLSLSITAKSQQTDKAAIKGIILKTNLLSLIAQRPTISIEKPFTGTFSIEASFVQGRFNNFFSTDHYDYTGLLIRAKKYMNAITFGKINGYGGLYFGNLKRNIQSSGYVDNTGWISFPSRDFSGNSIRGGGSLGLAYFSKNKIIIDGLSSLGYGRYTTIYKGTSNSNGYLDIQVWLSVGYCF